MLKVKHFYKNIMTENNEVDEIFDKFNGIIENLNSIKYQINSLHQQLKVLEKTVNKKMKGMKKNIEKQNKNKGNKKPSGFAKPTKVTNELCLFMNKTEGTEIARTEVTKAIVSYIKTNNLENKKNSKIIEADETLKHLLGIDDNQELTYFNLQKYMNKHFIGKVLNSDNV